jgi:hypothetical protein
MAETITVAALQRYKMPDGSYAIILPVNTTDEVYVDIGKQLTLTSELTNININIVDNRDSLIDDMTTLISTLSPYIPKPLQLKYIIALDMSSVGSQIIVNTGMVVDSAKIMI